MREEVKELGIIVHVPQHQPFIKMFQEGLNSYKKEEMIKAVYKGETKFICIREIKLTDKTNVDRMYQENRLCKAKFPKNINIEEIKNFYKEIMRTNIPLGSSGPTQEEESERQRSPETRRK